MSHQHKCNGQAYRVLATMSMFAAIGFAVAVSTASAQGLRETDLSVGYLNLGGSMQGGSVQLTVPVTERWSVVGEFDASRGRDCPGCEPEYRDLAGLGGVRYVWRPSVRFAPFWQVLVGGLRSTAGEYHVDYCCGLGHRLRQGYTINYWALQPGGGITTMVTPRFGVRAQADVLFAIPDQSKWEGMSIFPRVTIGGVIRLAAPARPRSDQPVRSPASRR